MRFLRKLAASVALVAQLVSAGNAVAQAMPATVFNPTSVASGWSYDPSTQGMRDLRELLPIEGCNAPGGLTRITDRDESDSAPFWCGTPPHCLAEGTNGVDACVFVPYCRREPRGDPSGISGGNGCRDPEDLLCVSSGAHPEGGQCLKTCWDGSRILFSQACPPQCSTDSLGNTTCIYDNPPSAPPRTPPTPTPGPAPTPTPTPTPVLDPCPSGSGQYGACYFSWGSAQSGQTLSVASSSSANGILRGTCYDGAWSVDELTCDTPTPITPVCPDGTAAPANGICPAPTPGPAPTSCPDGTAMPASGICPILPVCPDGTPPQNGVCPSPPLLCSNGKAPVNGSCTNPCSPASMMWEKDGLYCKGELAGGIDGQSLFVSDARYDGSDPTNSINASANYQCNNGVWTLQYGSCSFPSACTTIPHYETGVAYDYCTKKTEYAGTYQNTTISGGSGVVYTINVPPPYLPERAYPVLNLYWAACAGQMPDPIPAGHLESVQETNILTRSTYCID